MSRQKIFERINAERDKRDLIYGGPQVPRSRYQMYVVLGEEFGEVGRGLLENDMKNYEDELYDVIQVAVCSLEQLYCQQENGREL